MNSTKKSTNNAGAGEDLRPDIRKIVDEIQWPAQLRHRYLVEINLQITVRTKKSP